jgi:hypothetical protein
MNVILIYDLSQSLDQIPDSPVAIFPHPSFGTIQLLYEKGYKGYN